METLMLVMGQAARGRDAEMNDWYTWVHIRDVMRLPGSISVQRFSRGSVQPARANCFGGHAWDYLTLYEVGDRQACTKGHQNDLFTDRMPISSAFDMETFYEGYFDPLPTGDAFSNETADAPVLLVAFDTVERSDGPTATNALAARLANLPGLRGAHAFAFSSEQMLSLTPPNRNVLVCHLADISLAVAAWDRLVPELPAMVPGLAIETLSASVYMPLMRRLPASHVLSAPPEEEAIAVAMRRAMADRVHPPSAAAG